MRLRIVPPVFTVYPGDRIEFTADAGPPPPLWASVTNSGDIQADSSLAIDAGQDSTSAVGGHKLFSGSGRVELKINNLCLPTGSGVLKLNGDITDTSAFVYQYKIEITATAVTVKNEAAATIFTQPYSTVSGDIYQLELNAGFRLYRKGAELHARVGLPTQIVYPMGYSCELAEDTVTEPGVIPPPRLIGQGWRLGNVVTWTAPAHGSLSTTGPGVTTEYSGGTVPGRYTLAAQVEPGADATGAQRATATIDIPALEILGATELELQPGQKVRIKTNYDEAQNPLIALSIVSGGGSISGSEFTAPSAPGTTIVRAAAAINGQAANLTITVPAVVGPEIGFAAPGDPVDFATNLTDPIWAASLGQIAISGLWIVPDLIGQKARITATAGGVTVTRDVEIVEKFPRSDFKLDWPIDYAKRVLLSEAEDGTRTSRIKTAARRSFPVELLVDAVEDLNGKAGLRTIRDFWDRHHPGLRFIMEDPEEGIQLVMYTDSELRWVHTGAGIEIVFRVKGAE
jgi:hypothetical protein